MKEKIAKRAAELIIILLVLSFLTFLLMYLAPGDPAEKRLSSQGVAVTKEMLQAEQERLGLMRPFMTRYGEWIVGILHGDFGDSFKDDQPVAPKLIAGLKNTAILALASLLLALLVSVPLGIIAAVRRNSIIDHIVRLLSFIGNALPNFLISVLLMYFLCILLNLFPVVASGSFQGLFLPAVSLAIPMAGRFTRQIRTEIMEQLDQPETETDDHYSIGLSNVHQRIRILFGEPYGLKIESIPGTRTVISIQMPATRKEELEAYVQSNHRG